MSDGSEVTFLDLGCCVGQVLRKLVVDGADSTRLFGVDLEPAFLRLGYELFRDGDRFKATLIAGDVLAESRPGVDDGGLLALDGKIDIVHAGAFFHLFSWKKQVQAAVRLVRFLRAKNPNVFIWGRHMGVDVAGNRLAVRDTGEERFLHNAASWQTLWDEVGTATGTKWRVEWDVADEASSREGGIHISRFGVYRA